MQFTIRSMFVSILFLAVMPSANAFGGRLAPIIFRILGVSSLVPAATSFIGSSPVTNQGIKQHVALAGLVMKDQLGSALEGCAEVVHKGKIKAFLAIFAPEIQALKTASAIAGKVALVSGLLYCAYRLYENEKNKTKVMEHVS